MRQLDERSVFLVTSLRTMGLLPKSKKLGPLRFTRRKSGIGVSVAMPKMKSGRRRASAGTVQQAQPVTQPQPPKPLSQTARVMLILVGSIVLFCLLAIVALAVAL